MKCDKEDLKKLKQLLFYSMPLARKFAEQLASPAPDPRREYWVTDDEDPPDDLMELEADESGGQGREQQEAQQKGATGLARMTVELPQATQRKRRTQQNPQGVRQPKIARVETMPAFPFEDAYEEYQ